MNKFKNTFRRIQKSYFRLRGYYPAKIGDSYFKLDYQNFDFWKEVSSGDWESETFKVLSEYLDQNSYYIDIGAWIGPTVVYAAKICKKVVCFEPDPVAYRLLLSNIVSNKLYNVSPFNVAISNRTSIRKMSSFGGHLGDSMTSLLPSRKKYSASFDALILDWGLIEKIFKVNKVDMVKIDIEGGEFTLIPKLEGFLKKYSPIVWISIHIPLLDKNTKYDEIQNLIDVMMRCYKICLNSNLEKIDFHELKNEKSMTGFPSFLFKN